MVKRNHTSKPTSTQLALFSDFADDARRDPRETVIVSISQQHNFPIQRTEINGSEMYAVQDWIAGVSQNKNPRRLWSDAKKSNPHLYDSIVQLPYIASDGKTYQVDYADGQALYSITQYLRAKTGIRDQVLATMAQSMAFVDAARRDPESAEIALNIYAQQVSEFEGKDDTWIAVREMGKVTRKQLIALILNRNPKTNVGIATNVMYQNTLGMDTDALIRHLGLKPKSNPRDHMSRIALMYTMISEEAARIHLEGYADDDIIPAQTIYAIVRTVSEGIGIQARDMARQLQIDLVTGRKLLGSGQ